MESLGDANSRYDVFGNYSRAMTATGVPRPHLERQPRYERVDDGKEYGRWRHPMSGHIYERDSDGRVAVTDLDDNVSTFDCIFAEVGVSVRLRLLARRAGR